jgi:hypothetical protein
MLTRKQQREERVKQFCASVEVDKAKKSARGKLLRASRHTFGAAAVQAKDEIADYLARNPTLKRY